MNLIYIGACAASGAGRFRASFMGAVCGHWIEELVIIVDGKFIAEERDYFLYLSLIEIRRSVAYTLLTRIEEINYG